MGPQDQFTAEELHSLSVPTLLVWGARERVLPKSNFRFFERHLPSTAAIESPSHFGHAAFLEYPEEVARRLVAFASA